MAADQGIVNAYNRYFQAQEQADLMSDPFYQFTILATQAAQEWKLHQAKLQEKAGKYAARYEEGAETALVNAMDGLNPQASQVVNDVLGQLNTQMDVAKQQGDKNKIRALYSDAQRLASQLKKVNGLTTEHLKAIKGGTYSKGADRTKLDQLVDKDNELSYEFFIESNPENEGYLNPVIRLKDANGAVTTVGLDELDEGNVMRADAVADNWGNAINASVKAALESGDHKFDEARYRRTIDKLLANKDTLISAAHDDLFGQDKTIAEMWRENHKGKNDSWMNVWQKHDSIDGAVTGMDEAGGFNETELREYVSGKMMQFAKEDFQSQLNSRLKKMRAGKNSGGSNSVQVGAHKYMDKEVVTTIKDNIQNRTKIDLGGGQQYIPQSNGTWLIEGGENNGDVIGMDPNGNVLPEHRIMQSLIATLASFEEMPFIQLKPSLGFTQLYAPNNTQYNSNR